MMKTVLEKRKKEINIIVMNISIIKIIIIIIPNLKTHCRRHTISLNIKENECQCVVWKLKTD